MTKEKLVLFFFGIYSVWFFSVSIINIHNSLKEYRIYDEKLSVLKQENLQDYSKNENHINLMLTKNSIKKTIWKEVRWMISMCIYITLGIKFGVIPVRVVFKSFFKP